MRARSFVCAVIGLALACSIPACFSPDPADYVDIKSATGEQPDNTNYEGESAKMTFVPACGKPGDVIRIKVNTDSCTRLPASDWRATAVTFTNGATVRASDVSGESRDYTLTVTVPEGAKTGPVNIHGCGNLTDSVLRGRTIFTIPCPEDAGTEDSGTKTEPPVGGGVRVGMNQSSSNSPAAPSGFGEFRKAVSPEVLERFAAYWENEHRAYRSIPVGTCGDNPIPSTPPNGEAEPVDAGASLKIEKNGEPLGTFERQAGNYYNFRGDAFAFGMTASLLIPGGPELPGTTLTDAMPFAKDFELTNASWTSGARNPFPTNGYTLTWKPFQGETFYAVLSGGPVRGKVCHIDPNVGSFTIPQSAFDAVKSSPLPMLDMTIGSQAEKRVPITIANEQRTFVLESVVRKHLFFSKQ